MGRLSEYSKEDQDRINGRNTDEAAKAEPAKNAYRPSAVEIERSELQGDAIALFRAEY